MNKSGMHQHQARNAGIDALRLFSMYMIVLVHVLGWGGVMRTASGAGRIACGILEVFVYCSVNCFAMISGYVAYTETEKPYKYSKYVDLWIQVALYSFGITVLFYLWDPLSVSYSMFFESLLPVSTYQYWYFAEYTAVFFLAPWFCRLARACSQAEMKRLMLTLFLLFSCFGTRTNGYASAFILGRGYSFLWLSVMYMIGAGVRKCALDERVSRKAAAMGITVCVLCTWAVRHFLGWEGFMAYTSPTMLLTAALLLILFSRLQLGERRKKAVFRLAPASFGVYLIHVHPLVWERIMLSRFRWIGETGMAALPLTLLCAAAVFVVCMMIELTRMTLFELLGVNRLIRRVCAWTARIGHKAV